MSSKRVGTYIRILKHLHRPEYGPNIQPKFQPIYPVVFMESIILKSPHKLYEDCATVQKILQTDKTKQFISFIGKEEEDLTRIEFDWECWLLCEGREAERQLGTYSTWDWQTDELYLGNDLSQELTGDYYRWRRGNGRVEPNEMVK